MGAVQSYFRDTYHGLAGLIATISEGGELFNEIIARIGAPALLTQDSTTSFWQLQPPFPELVNIRSEKLPQKADIVIIGSGITGASIAYTILNESHSMGVPRNVTILEGRTVASGATGRNGGHIKSSPYAEYVPLKKRFGAAGAQKILKFQARHLPFILRLAEEEGHVQGEVRAVQTIDCVSDKKTFERMQQGLEALQNEVPELAKGIEVINKTRIQEEFGLDRHYEGGMKYRTGALWPYRFITSIYTSLLKKFPGQFSIETGTMVQDVRVSNDPETPFLLKTSRGDIQANQVVHATDASAANLIPGLVGKIFPGRGHMTAQRPGKSFPNYNGNISWSFVTAKGYEYISQRPGLPDADNGLGAEIMIGGGAIHNEFGAPADLGIWSDNDYNHSIAAYLGGMLPATFNARFWGEDPDGSQVKNTWSGLMGFTIDALPYVGRLSPALTQRPVKKSGSQPSAKASKPDPSEWISAGFQGAGMVETWLSGAAIALQILGRENVKSEGQYWRPEGVVKDWLPEQFVVSPKRVARSSIYELPSLLH